MVFDIIRFNLFSLDLLRSKSTDASGREVSIGEYLDKEGYGQVFREDYLLASLSRSSGQSEADE